MCSSNRLAIFVLPSDDDAQLIRCEQHYLTRLTGNSVALGFPIHITLKGRFSANQEVIESALKNICQSYSHLFTGAKTDIYLSGPQYVQPQLAWLEVLTDSKGFKLLIHLHEILEKEINRFDIRDEVPEAHKYRGFRPHITLGWDIKSHIWQEYLVNRNFCLRKIQIKYIALASYPQNWPANESIDLPLKISI